MANPFDQFDAVPQQVASSNFFDQFDAPKGQAPAASAQEKQAGNFFDQFDSAPAQTGPKPPTATQMAAAKQALAASIDNATFDRNDPRFQDMSSSKALEGIPVLGAYVPKAGAALAALASPLTGVGSDGGSFSERYHNNLAQEEAASRTFDREHPVASAVDKMVGGTLALAPIGATATGAKLLGMAPEMSLGARALLGAGSGATIGGADAAARGENIGKGALIGGTLGGALPLGGAALGKAVEPITAPIFARINPEAAASRQFARGVQESGLSPEEIANRVTQAAAEGQPEFAVADAMGNAGQRLLSSTARAEGEGRTAVVNALENRQAMQGRRVANALDEGFGAGGETAAQAEARMTGARNAAADAEYGAVRNDAQPVDVSSVLKKIDSTIKPYGVDLGAQSPDSAASALVGLRNRLTDGTAVQNDFNALQRVRGDLSDQIGAAVRAGAGNKARLLTGAMRELDSSMEAASPGFRDANANFAQASRDIDAIGQGRTAATRGRTEDTIPAFQALGPDAQQAFRTGYVDPLIAQTQQAAVGVNKARPLLADAMKDEAAAIAPGNELMQRRLAREGTMFETRNAALGGSKTADNLADAAALDAIPSVIGHLAHGNFVGAARHLITSSGDFLTGNTPQVRAKLADMLLRSGANVTPDQLSKLTATVMMTRPSMAAVATRGAAQSLAQQP